MTEGSLEDRLTGNGLGPLNEARRLTGVPLEEPVDAEVDGQRRLTGSSGRVRVRAPVDVAAYRGPVDGGWHAPVD